MASSYFTLPSFARAKKNKEELEKTNPQEPVLKDEDEKFFDKEMRSGSTVEAAKDAEPVKITDDGEEKPVAAEEKEQAVKSDDQTIMPENRPDSGYDGASYEQKQQDEAAAAAKERKEKKRNKGMDLPSQEEAEAATRAFGTQPAESGADDKSQGEKKTWASYISSMGKRRPESSDSKDQTDAATKEGAADEKEDGDEQTGDQAAKPTWAEFASSYVPSMPKFGKKSDADSKHEPVYNEDGTINEAATKEKEEREVSVLLDNLNLSSINNRVFSFSADTQKLYERFLLCLKDVINGAPTAYEDMDKLMKDAGPKLEEQWKQMPPFVQTLVKSLPMKLGPELAAVASESPNNQLKAASANNASKAGDNASGFQTAEAGPAGEEKKSKRKIPGMKYLTGQSGAVGTMLRNTASFITTRFPFLASTTNVVMSLSVFILMFVFWYCHKRGKEVRLAKEAEGKDSVEGVEDDELEVSDTADEGEVEEMVHELKKVDETNKDSSGSADDKAAILNQSAPAEVPLPDEKAETSTTQGEESDKRDEAVAAT